MKTSYKSYTWFLTTPENKDIMITLECFRHGSYIKVWDCDKKTYLDHKRYGKEHQESIMILEALDVKNQWIEKTNSILTSFVYSEQYDKE